MPNMRPRTDSRRSSRSNHGHSNASRSIASAHRSTLGEETSSTGVTIPSDPSIDLGLDPLSVRSPQARSQGHLFSRHPQTGLDSTQGDPGHSLSVVRGGTDRQRYHRTPSPEATDYGSSGSNDLGASMHNFPPSPPARSQPQRSTGAERLQTDKQKTKYGGKKKSHTTESETAVFSWRFDPGNLVPGYGGGMDGGYHQGFHQAGGYTPQTTYPDRFDFTGGFVHRPPLTYGLAPGNGGVDGPGPQTPFPYPRIIDPEDLYDRDHQPNTGTGHVGNRDGPVNQEQGDDRAMRDVDMSWGDQEWYTGDVGNRDGSVDQGQGEGRDVDMFSGEEEWNVVDHADTKDDSLVDQARSLYYHRPSYPPNIAEEDFCD